MPYYRRVGDVPRHRHVLHRAADGTVLTEELVSHHGFSGASSLLYHRRRPSALLSVTDVSQDWRVAGAEVSPPQPLAPAHLRTADVATGDDLVTGRVRLLANADVSIGWAVGAQASPLYRRAIGDELVFVHEGSVRLETVFGALDLRAGHYVVVPGGCVHRWVPYERTSALFVEARGAVIPPRRYRNAAGQFLEGSTYAEREILGPTEPLIVDDPNQPTDVLVAHGSHLSLHRMASHPFDVVGWDGAVWPWAVHVDDLAPIVGRFHLPPPIHQTFEGDGFVVCTFAPRPADFDPEAVAIPYHHSNVHSDEVLFYTSGNFASRTGSGIGLGSITLHPAGFVHGPQPGSLARNWGKAAWDEVAVMVDTFAPLGLTAAARSAADAAYLRSWVADGDDPARPDDLPQ